MTTSLGIRRTAGIVTAIGIVLTMVTPAQASDPDSVRFATFNASLNRFDAGQLITDLSTPDNAQAANVAEVIQRTAPDIVLINEFDFDPDGTALRLFQDNYLSVPHNGAPAIDYAYSYTAPVNTGVPSGFDLNNDGTVGGPDDAFGFGFFPGQFGMAVYSNLPINVDAIRTFQTFRWKDMPGALLPDNPSTPESADFYSPEELEVFRLSSKSHWDLPVQVGRRTVHFLVSHPTPPVFDGEEDRNGRRNSDEIRFWADYITPADSGYIYDDDGGYGGLPFGAQFVVAGDQNSDPLDGDSLPGSIDQLLDDPRVNDGNTPSSFGAVQASIQQGGANQTHLSPPRYDTADFSDTEPGNLRADYLLPSRPIRILSSAVFWPVSISPLYRLVYDPGFSLGVASSDHRLVWADLRVLLA
ncbi:MAG: endonuclease/exonuclease/phosphatase family protein [Geodermatophilaceae bacterium]|nr:endonuclease/exonuclease/phosphatase family protein [Geodermatophilaceae bacterium]